MNREKEEKTLFLCVIGRLNKGSYNDPVFHHSMTAHVIYLPLSLSHTHTLTRTHSLFINVSYTLWSCLSSQLSVLRVLFRWNVTFNGKCDRNNITEYCLSQKGVMEVVQVLAGEFEWGFVYLCAHIMCVCEVQSRPFRHNHKMLSHRRI